MSLGTSKISSGSVADGAVAVVMHRVVGWAIGGGSVAIAGVIGPGWAQQEQQTHAGGQRPSALSSGQRSRHAGGPSNAVAIPLPVNRTSAKASVEARRSIDDSLL